MVLGDAGAQGVEVRNGKKPSAASAALGVDAAVEGAVPMPMLEVEMEQGTVLLRFICPSLPLSESLHAFTDAVCAPLSAAALLDLAPAVCAAAAAWEATTGDDGGLGLVSARAAALLW